MDTFTFGFMFAFGVAVFALCAAAVLFVGWFALTVTLRVREIIKARKERQ